jgi:hypothetical protein
MRAYILFTATGAVVVMTKKYSIRNSQVLKSLGAHGIGKFVAHRIPIELAKKRYASHFDTVIHDPRQATDLKILEDDGEKVFKMFKFSDIGPAIYHEPGKLVKARA